MKRPAASVFSHTRVAARLENAHGPIGLADRGHHVAHAVVLELLRRRSLLVDVVAVALAERLIHLALGTSTTTIAE